MLESAMALQKKFKVDLLDIIDHIRDLLLRFNNRALKDTCRRVGADVERKLGPADRFIGAINCCFEQGVTPAFISIGAAAALHCSLKERALEQTEENACIILEKTSALETKSVTAALILDMYKKILQKDTPKELLHYALLLGYKPGII
jgi:mannitol-1-phosphate 5-dehydrogenase